MTAEWDLARLWHTIAQLAPGRPALVHGSHTVAWGQFDTAAAAVAEAPLASVRYNVAEARP